MKNAMKSSASRFLAVSTVMANAAGTTPGAGDGPAEALKAIQALAADMKAQKIELDAVKAELDNSRRMIARSRLASTGPDRPNALTLEPLAHYLTGREPQNSMSVGQDSKGGFTVTPEIDRVIAEYAREGSAMRRLSRTVLMETGSEFEILFTSKRAEAGGWVGETQERTGTEGAGMSKITIPLHASYAEPKVTQRVLDDSSFDIEAFVSGEITGTLGELENAAYVNGNGVVKPKGFLTYDSSTEDDATRPLGTLQHVLSGNDGAFEPVSTGVLPADRLTDMVYSLNVEYRTNASWLMNSKTAATVRKMKDGEGNYLWQQSLAAGQPSTLLGYPVEIDENMPDIASGSKSIAFGDFRRGYCIVDRMGLNVLRDAYTLKGWVKFYTTRRTGGGIVDSRAIKVMKFSAS